MTSPTICRSTVVATIRRFELAVRAHSFRGTLISNYDDREAGAALWAVDHEYALAKARLLASIGKRIV